MEFLKEKLEELVNKYNQADDIQENIEDYMGYIQRSNPDKVLKFKINIHSDGIGRKSIVVAWVDKDINIYTFIKELDN